jgi:Transposase zinc-ribbon domain
MPNRPKAIDHLTASQFFSRFPDEDACKRYLMQCRWPEGVRCPRCGNDDLYDASSFKPFHWMCTPSMRLPVLGARRDNFSEQAPFVARLVSGASPHDPSGQRCRHPARHAVRLAPYCRSDMPARSRNHLGRRYEQDRRRGFARNHGKRRSRSPRANDPGAPCVGKSRITEATTM